MLGTSCFLSFPGFPFRNFCMCAVVTKFESDSSTKKFRRAGGVGKSQHIFCDGDCWLGRMISCYSACSIWWRTKKPRCKWSVSLSWFLSLFRMQNGGFCWETVAKLDRSSHMLSAFLLSGFSWIRALLRPLIPLRFFEIHSKCISKIMIGHFCTHPTWVGV